MKCSICLEALNKLSRLIPCFHEFCLNCITFWLKISQSCPICRSPTEKLAYNFISPDHFDIIPTSKSMDIKPDSYSHRRILYSNKKLYPFIKDLKTKNSMILSSRVREFMSRELKVLLSDLYEEWMVEYIFKCLVKDDEIEILNEYSSQFKRHVLYFIRSGLNVKAFDECVEFKE